jgi:Transposase IS4
VQKQFLKCASLWGYGGPLTKSVIWGRIPSPNLICRSKPYDKALEERLSNFFWKNSINKDSTKADSRELVYAGMQLNEALKMVEAEELAQMCMSKRGKSCVSYVEVDEDSDEEQQRSGKSRGAKSCDSNIAPQNAEKECKGSKKRPAAPCSVVQKASKQASMSQQKPSAQSAAQSKGKGKSTVTKVPAASKPSKATANMNDHPFLEDLTPCLAPPKPKKAGRPPADFSMPELDSDSEYETEKEDEDDEDVVFQEIEYPSIEGFLYGCIDTPEDLVPKGVFPGDYPDKASCVPLPGTFDKHSSPFEIFTRLIEADVTMPRLVEHTNLKFEQWQQGGGKTFDKDEDEDTSQATIPEHVRLGKVFGLMWTPVDLATMYIFMAMCFTMAIVGCADTSMYWSTIACGLVPAFNWKLLTGVSEIRWRQIKKFLTINIITEEDKVKTGDRKGRTKDKLHRLRPLINTLRRVFMQVVRAGLIWSIDESICPYRGKYCPAKVYMKDKPHKFGMKIWMINCATTGYCFDFKVYEGKGDAWFNEPDEWKNDFSLGERVLLNMSANVPRGSYIFCDRFFTTPKVCAYMLELGKFLTGTAKKMLTAIDKSILFNKSKKFPRGYFKWVYNILTKVVQICWMDRQPVIFLSNCFGAAKAPGGVGRLTTTSGKHERRPMVAPLAAKEYNKFMGVQTALIS